MIANLSKIASLNVGIAKAIGKSITVPLLQLSSDQGDWSPGSPIPQAIAYCNRPKTKNKKNKRKGQVTRTKANFKTPPLQVKSSNPN